MHLTFYAKINVFVDSICVYVYKKIDVFIRIGQVMIDSVCVKHTMLMKKMHTHT